MDKKAVQQLCQSGAFSQFKELADSIELPEIRYGEDVTYQLGKRDGAIEFKNELFEIIEKIAKS